MKKQKKKRQSEWKMVMPLLLILLVFIVLPLLCLVFMSFMSRDMYGGIEYHFSMDAWKLVFSVTNLKILFSSLKIGAYTTIGCILLGYPIAAIMAKSSKRTVMIMTMLLMIPFCTNSLIRMYSWVNLMATEGIIDNILLSLHIIKKPIEMLYTDGAIVLGMTYSFLVTAILPMYSSIEKLDHSVIEASHDLGASGIKTFFRVQLPLTSSGIFAAVLMTFIPTLGYYTISDILGGSKIMMVGNLIKDQFSSANNWPFGAAVSLVLVVFILVLLHAYSRVADLDSIEF